tara:strand:- start:7002 stop:7733 length:732 start_codon:yes stop_codon:yes gene_type:complete
MRILIIGGRGYLGWQLYNYLNKKHHCQISKKKNIVDVYNLSPKKNKLKFAVIIILSGKNYSQINTKNIHERRKIVSYLLKNKIQSNLIIYFSTKMNYSKNLIKNSYVKSHRLAEEYLKKKYAKNSFKIIRLSNVFGLNFMPLKKNIKSSSINLFINDLIKNKKIKLKTPYAKREWITISDFLKLNEKIINGKKVNKINSKKITIKNFYRKLHEVRKSDGNFKNQFDYQIFKTFKILEKLNNKK